MVLFPEAGGQWATQQFSIMILCSCDNQHSCVMEHILSGTAVCLVSSSARLSTHSGHNHKATGSASVAGHMA